MSQFLQHPDDYTPSIADIDWDGAERLPTGGSTCDIFRTRWQRREVVVKRLKPELADKPIYLDAMEKEFEVGVGLTHPSLPHYRELHRTFIVMDFIDGVTLAEMLAANDAWLRSRGNAMKLLRQLVEVVDYLHRHNVTHCDIKTDNIMVTSNGKNLVLIDLDKCYTDAINDTPGHPGRFGLPLDKAGGMAVDFHGIALVAEAIGAALPRHLLRRFVKACRVENAGCETLSALLDSPRRGRWVGWLAAPAAIAAVAAIWVSNQSNQSNQSDLSVQSVQSELPESVGLGELGDSSKKPTVSETPVSREDIHATAQQKAAVLDGMVMDAFRELHAGLDHLESLRADTTTTAEAFRQSLVHHATIEDEIITEAFATLIDTWPGTSEREAWRIMAYSKAYTDYKRRASAFERSLMDSK